VSSTGSIIGDRRLEDRLFEGEETVLQLMGQEMGALRNGTPPLSAQAIRAAKAPLR